MFYQYIDFCTLEESTTQIGAGKPWRDRSREPAHAPAINHTAGREDQKDGDSEKSRDTGTSAGVSNSLLRAYRMIQLSHSIHASCETDRGWI